ncbi:hypothetical protein DEO72_LG10g3077 [Vigna unguiculata]|uniref:Uncharacterized protein n=1 Tax=Vigna unguiculata TaxID=3917 RepID=A0A4D6NGZ0_VIGUN|nr:hypothetical protein DEO72_LG10g3077 [Vigna unguiculata]
MEDSGEGGTGALRLEFLNAPVWAPVLAVFGRPGGEWMAQVDVVVFEVVGGRAWRRSCQCGGEGGRPDFRRVCLKVEARELRVAV